MQELAAQRPFYGTRRMAAQLSRELRMPVNRKRVQKVFRTLNWIEPAKTKSQVIRSASKVVRASRPREFGSHQEAEAAVGEAFTDYNRDRIHSALDYMTPYEYLDEWKGGRVNN